MRLNHWLSGLFPRHRFVDSSIRRRLKKRRTVQKNWGTVSAMCSHIQSLELRTLLSGTTYVAMASNFAITNDTGDAGLSAGDTVTFRQGLTSEVTGLVFGTDAFTSIQSAVNEVDFGGTVLVDMGTYNESVTINKSLALKSVDGRDSTTIVGNAAQAPHGTLVISNTSNVTVGAHGEGFTIVGIDKNNPLQENSGVYLEGSNSNVTIQGNRVTAGGDTALVTQYNLVNTGLVIDGNIFDGKSFTGTNPASGSGNSVVNGRRPLVYIAPGTGPFQFTNNEVIGASGGPNGNGDDLVILRSESAATVTGNVFSGTTGTGRAALVVYGTNSTIFNNSFQNGTNFALNNASGGTVNASGNWWGTTNPTQVRVQGSVDFTAMLLSGVDQDPGTAGFQGDFSEVLVHTRGAQTGSVGRIQEGVNLVDAGGTVHVTAGTFVHDGQFDINKSVTIIGAGQDETIIKRSGQATGNEFRTLQVNASDVTFQSLQFAGWSQVPSDANVGRGYLVWLNADGTTFDDVRFDGNDIRVAIYVGTTNELTVTDSRFTGTYFRAAIRGGGEHMLISRNSFEESHYWYSPIYFEYGAPTSGEISYNYFANRVGVNNQVHGNFKEDGTGLYAITNFQPNKITADGLQIVHNTFHFQDRDLVNAEGVSPKPIAIYNDPALVATGPIEIRDNIFQGYSYTGVQPGSDPAWQPAARSAPYDGVLAFDGSTTVGGFELPNDIGNAGTISFWINPTDVGGQRRSIFNGAGIEVTLRNGTIYFYPDSSETSSLTYATTGAFAANTWTHVAVSWDYATQTTAIYINGVEASYQTGDTPTDATWTTPANTANKIIHVGHDLANLDRDYAGQMDDIGIFNAKLSVSEINNVRTNGVSSVVGDARLVAGWTLNESTGFVSTGIKNGVDLLVSTSGLSPFTLDPEFVPGAGYIGGALEFNAANRSFGSFRSSEFDIGAKGSLALWINPTDVGSQRHQILDGGGMGFTIRNNNVYFYTVSGNDNTLTYTNDNAIQANTWNHVVFTWDLDTQTTHIYVNGVEASYVPANSSFHPGWTSAANTLGQLMTLGMDLNNPDRAYGGKMDDIGIFNQALTAGEVASLYTGEVADFAADPRLVTHWNLDNLVGTTEVPSDHGRPITLYLQQVAALPPFAGHAILSSPNTQVSNNLFYDNDVDYNVAVTDLGDNLFGPPVFNLGLFDPNSHPYQIGFGSLAAYASTEFQNDSGTDSPHIGAYQGPPGLFGTGDLVINGSDGDDLLEITITGENSGVLKYTKGLGSIYEEIVDGVVLTNITGITFYGGLGDDRLVITNPAGSVFSPVNGIVFEGGDGGEDGDPSGNPLGDRIEILDGTATSVDHVFTGVGEGSIHYNGTQAITYTGVEAPNLDTVTAANRFVSFAGGVETITLAADGTRTLATSTQGNGVSFVTPTTQTTIRTTEHGGSGDDVLDIQGLGSDFNSILNVTLSNDNVEVTGATTLSKAFNLTGARNVTFDAGSLDFTGSIVANLTASEDIVFVNGGSLTTVNGKATLTAGDEITMEAGTGISSSNANIDLIAAGNATVTGIQTTKVVTVKSTSGSILDGGDTDADVDALRVLLQAHDAVDGLDLFVNNVEGSAGAGGFTVTQTGKNLSVGGVDAVETGVATTGGTISITVDGATLTVTEDLNSNGGAISLSTTTSGNVNVNRAVNGQTLAVTSAGNAVFGASSDVRTAGATTINAAVNTAFNGFSEVQTLEVEAGGTVSVGAAGDVNASGSIDLNSTGGQINMADGGSLNSINGPITLTADTNVRLSSVTTTGNVIVEAGSAIISNSDGTNIEAASADLTAGTNIGAAGNAIDLEVDSLTLTAGGNVFVADLDDLELGDASSTNNGHLNIFATGAMTVAGTVQTVHANREVTLTAGSITVSGAGEVVSARDTILNADGDITLENSSQVTAGRRLYVNGGASGSGSTISLLGTVQSTNPALINGGSGDDLFIVNPGAGDTQTQLELDGVEGSDDYQIHFGNLTGTVNVVDSGVAGDDRAIVIGTADDDVFVIGNNVANGNSQTGGSVTLNNIGSQLVNYSTSLEALNVQGGAGNDTFHVQPSQTATLLIDGGTPGFGAGPEDFPQVDGDVIDLDPLDNTFQIVGTSIQVAGGAPEAFKPINFVRIEGLPLTPIGDTAWQFDFNSGSGVTQNGYTAVERTQIYGNGVEGADFGWVSAPPTIAFDRGAGIGGDLEALLRDGHLDSANRTFRADVADGWYLVSVKIGDQLSARDQIRIVNPESGQILLDNVSTAAGEFITATFVVQATDGSLSFTISDEGGANTQWVLNSLEIRPADLLTIGIADVGPFVSDGVTQHTFEIFNVTPGANVTVVAALDTDGDGIADFPVQVLTPDASPELVGAQIEADNEGRYFVTIASPSGKGTVYLQLAEVSGDRTGLGAVDFDAPSTRRFDFNTPTSPTQAPVAADGPNANGYTSTLPTTIYSDGLGYGWLTSTVGIDRGDLNPDEAQEDLRRDGHIGSIARTFRTQLAAGSYWVNVTMGDYQAARDQMQVFVNGSVTPAVEGLTAPAGQFVTGGFLVTVGEDGILDLTFADAGGANANWVINGLEIRPESSATQIGFSVSGDPEVPADGVSTRVITGTATGLTDGTLVTITTSLGTILGADASTQYVGHQVAVVGGQFQFTIQAPTGAGIPVFTANAVDGSAFGEASDVIEFVFHEAALSWSYDFNSGASPTQTGYTGVLPTTTYNSSLGYGWVGATPIGFNRTLAEFDGSNLLRDGHLGGAGVAGRRTFRVDLAPSTTYSVTVTLGDAQTSRDFMEIRDAAGNILVNNIHTAAGEFKNVTFNVTTDSNGALQLQFGDTGGNANWTVNGLVVRNVVSSLTVTPPSLTALPAGPSATDQFTVGGLTVGATYTLNTTLGTIVSVGGVAVADASSYYAGLQFVATSTSATIEVVRPAGPGTVTVNVEQLNGEAFGSASQVYVPNSVQRYDFNGAAQDTADGFVGVSNTTLFSQGLGYGWVTSPTAFQRTSASESPSLYRDGAMGGAGAAGARTFQTAVSAGGTYDVRIYTGDANAARDQLQITVEGVVGTLVNTGIDNYVTVLFEGIQDLDNDGILNITFRDMGGNANWTVNGVEIAEVSAQLTFDGDVGAGAGSVTQNEADDLLAAAINRMVLAGFNADLFDGVQVQIVDFGAKGTLGVTGGNVILIDNDAFGHGWYVDVTPTDDSEFPAAGLGNAAEGKVDLLTVLMHHLGRIAGETPIDGLSADWMSDELGVSTRRLPS